MFLVLLSLKFLPLLILLGIHLLLLLLVFPIHVRISRIWRSGVFGRRKIFGVDRRKDDLQHHFLAVPQECSGLPLWPARHLDH